MKKIFALITLLIFACTLTVSATTYRNAGELRQSWGDNFPDYICGVWSTDGGSSNLTFGIQNNEAGEAGKQEILELVEDDFSVSFVYQEFTRNYLYQIFQDLHQYFQEDIGLVVLSLDDFENCVELEILDNRQSDPKTQSAVAKIIEKYGNAVSVKFIDERLMPTAQAGEVGPMEFMRYGQESMMLFLTAIALLMCVVLVIVVRKKMLLQTHNGATVSPDQPSFKEVERMVEKFQCNIPSDLKQKVMTAIETLPPEG